LDYIHQAIRSDIQKPFMVSLSNPKYHLGW